MDIMVRMNDANDVTQTMKIEVRSIFVSPITSCVRMTNSKSSFDLSCDVVQRQFVHSCFRNIASRLGLQDCIGIYVQVGLCVCLLARVGARGLKGFE